MKNTKEEDLFETIKLRAWNLTILAPIKGIYDDLFEYAYNLGEVQVDRGYVMKVRSRYSQDNLPGLQAGELIYYSTENEVPVYDAQTDEVEQRQLDDGLYLSPRTARFFFAPSVHRLCTEHKSTTKDRIPFPAIQTYLKKVLVGYMDYMGIAEDHTAHVTPVTDIDRIEEILSRTDIVEIKASISYTNDDQTEDYEELLDREARKARSSSFDIAAKSQSGVPLSPKGTLFEGALRLAQQNGSAVVRCKPDVGEEKTYKTASYPLLETFTESTVSMCKMIYEWMQAKFKDREQ